MSISSILRSTTIRRSSRLSSFVRFLSSEEARQIDEAVVEKFKSHDLAFVNLPVEDVSFTMGPHYVTGEPFPMLKYQDRDEFGLVHLTPFALSTYSYFSKIGNFGTRKNLPNGVVEINDLAAAEQIVCVSDDPLIPGGERNTLMNEYIEWISHIQAKFAEFLYDNMDNFPMLKKKYQFMIQSADKNTMLEILKSEATSIYKEQSMESGESRNLFNIRQKVYFKSDPSSRKPHCQEDVEMAERGYVRRHVRLYDETGLEVPVENAVIHPGDLVSCRINLTCRIYSVGGNVGFGLRKNLRDVTRARERVQSSDSPNVPQSPYGNLV